MQKLINSQQISDCLIEDLLSCENYSFAVAWVTDKSAFYENLLKNLDKINIGIIGLDLAGTSPDVLEKLYDKSNIGFRQNVYSVFHPKTHVFNFGDYAHVYMGSSNLTSGGLGKNTEMNLMVKVATDSELYQEVMAEVLSYKYHTISNDGFTEEFFEEYRNRYEARQLFDRSLLNSDIDELVESLHDVKEYVITDLDWQSYAERVENEFFQEDGRAFEERLDLLDTVKNLFKKYGSLKNMSIEDQRIIVGISLKGDIDYYKYRGWFGTLQSIGQLMGYYNSKGEHYSQNAIEAISNAIDIIPLEGEVTEEQFKQYIKAILPVLKYDSEKSNSTAFFSRFLTLKRPDLFVSLNGANKEILEWQYGENYKHYSNYWKMIEWLKESEWYLVGDKNHSAWKYRMAFVDSLAYSYTNQDYL